MGMYLFKKAGLRLRLRLRLVMHVSEFVTLASRHAGLHYYWLCQIDPLSAQLRLGMQCMP